MTLPNTFIIKLPEREYKRVLAYMEKNFPDHYKNHIEYREEFLMRVFRGGFWEAYLWDEVEEIKECVDKRYKNGT